MVMNVPPAYTVLPLNTRAKTASFALGFQEVTFPLASSAATFFLAWPPMLVKPPPAYTVLPLTARAKTWSLAFGFQGWRSRSRRAPRCGSSRVPRCW
jgi:hypothetical protein